MRLLKLLAVKAGMSSFRRENGTVSPISLLYVPHHYVVQNKSMQKDGYAAIKLGSVKTKKINQAEAGICRKADVPHNCKHYHEFRIQDDEINNYALGDVIRVSDIFNTGILSMLDFVDVQGKSKGKGFAGVVKRHGFAIKNATHGNSKAHRTHGSTGTCTYIGKVLKGQKMAGHMGAITSKVQNLQILYVDEENSIVGVKGCVPGPRKGKVMITKAIKKNIE